MSKAKTNPLQQKFGLMDNDLKQPKHDDMMFWLDSNVDKFLPSGNWNIYNVIRNNEYYNYHREDKFKLSIDDILAKPDLPPFPPRQIIKKVWEEPIKTGYKTNVYVVGFADLMVLVTDYFLSCEFTREGELVSISVEKGYEPIRLYFEVKTKIPSLGELMRQIRLYQEYTKQSKWYVVCPDDKYKNKLNEQGIGFIKYQPEITQMGF